VSMQMQIPFEGLDFEPTPAMRADQQHVHQCGWCGTVVIVPTSIDGTRRTVQGRPCPACDHADRRWWRARIDGEGIAGFRLVES
jgi:hypothetical protein